MHNSKLDEHTRDLSRLIAEEAQALEDAVRLREDGRPRSELDEATKAYWRLHLRRLEAERARGAPPPVEVPGGGPSGPAPREPQARKPRVLVADDNTDAALTLGALLDLTGFEATVVHDGGAVLDAMERVHPEAVLLDIGMPVMNGYEVARRLREKYGPELLLIAITGWGSPADRQRGRDAGFNHYLTKPVDVTMLTGRLAALKRRE